MNKVSVHYETPERAPEPDWQALFESVESELGKKVPPLAVVFISEDKSRKLNVDYRKKDAPTNILSFNELREMYVCTGIVKKEADESHIDFKDWMTRIIVHGILHLEGFTHDETQNGEEMEEVEMRILKALGISLL